MTNALVLDPATPFSEMPRSDTLFGAICWGIRRVHDEATLESHLESFANGEPPFLISSAMPVLNVKDRPNRTFLLPKPRLPGPNVPGDELEQSRVEALQQWKSVEYLPAGIFRRLANGKASKATILDALERAVKSQRDRDGGDEDISVTIADERYVLHGGFLLPDEWRTTDDSVDGRETDRDERSLSPYRRETRIRNAVNRLTGATDGQLFQTERIHFGEESGIGVLVRGDTSVVAEALAMLQDTGIGGNRSVGNGQFTFEGVDRVELPKPTVDTDFVCSLSLWIPTDEERDALSDGYYEPETRKGVVENQRASPTNIWKRRVLALAEGSVLRTVNPETSHGHNPVVADEFSQGVQQYGYAFPISMTALD